MRRAAKKHPARKRPKPGKTTPSLGTFVNHQLTSNGFTLNALVRLLTELGLMALALWLVYLKFKQEIVLAAKLLVFAALGLLALQHFIQ